MNDDRYARHRAIPGFPQQRLQASRFGVIGAGAIGNEVVKNLCLLGVGAIDLYDLDTVERHNLTRSVLLREADIGSPKAAAVAAHARVLDPAVQVVAIHGDVRDTLGLDAVRRYRCVIGALDNFEARLYLNRSCWLAGVPWVDAAIDSRHASVETYPFGGTAALERDTDAAYAADAAPPACYECNLPPSVYRRIAARYACGGLLRAALRERVMPTTTITASFAGAQAVHAALRLATAAAPEPHARRWLFDSATDRTAIARLAPTAGCPTCGELPRGARRITVADASPRQVAAAARAAGAEAITFDGPLVWECACPACGPTAAMQAARLRPARTVTDAILRCTVCGGDRVAATLRDTIDVAELEALTDPGLRLPGRHAMAADTCLEWPATATLPADSP